MFEIGMKKEIHENVEQKLKVNDYHEIKPQGNITMQECRDFLNHLFRSEIPDKYSNNDVMNKNEGTRMEANAEKDVSEKQGGSYGEVFREGEGNKYEVHHMPADSVSNLERNDGPAIKMEKQDHRQTASCGSSREAREYRAMQKELINAGNFRGALQMDIDDIREKFGSKYDIAITQMLDYVDKLELGGKIHG